MLRVNVVEKDPEDLYFLPSPLSQQNVYLIHAYYYHQ